MRCPYCDLEARRRLIHLHLAEEHGNKLDTGREVDRERMFYRISCPQCDVKVEQTIKPRSKDAGFLEKFEREIRLVAFDMLLNHMEMAHDDSGQSGDP